MERFLSGGGADESPTVGTPLTLSVDAAQYKPSVGQAFLSADYSAKGTETTRKADITEVKELPLVTEKGMAKLTFTDSAKPGVYLFTFTRLKGSAAGSDSAEVPEYQAYAFNVDPRESDLRRAARDDVLQQAPGAALHSAGDAAWLDELKNKRTDLTEAGWIFLVLLLVLIAEQWLAVKLSFHTAHHGFESAAPSAAATFQRSTLAPHSETSTAA
jgi:hypothetical protein